MLPAHADSLARVHTAEAVGVVIKIMRGQEEGAGPVLNARLRAAQTIIDRGHGRAVQAVISIPARHAVAARVAAMSDDALLALCAARMGGGSTGENEGPVETPVGAGTIQDTLPPSAFCPTTPGGGRSGSQRGGKTQNRSAQALFPRGIRPEDIQDAEFEEITDTFDPCA